MSTLVELSASGVAAPSPKTEPAFQSFLKSALQSRPNHNADLLVKAYRFAEQVHQGQKRKSGAPYIHHVLAVGQILADLNQDTTTLAAGLLHDVVWQANVPLEQLQDTFGKPIAGLVDGVTKIKDLSFQSPEAEQVENFRKMFLSMAQDIRVILIKFADRLHNMRTLEHLPQETQERMVLESRDIYAPLAHRLGIARIRWELEDLSLKCLEPEAYRSIQEKITLKRADREAYIEKIRTPLQKALDEAGIRAEITGRAKNFNSINKKMKRRDKAFEEIYDLFAIRILVDTLPECYNTLGLIHSLHTPVMSRFKDFIATPKSNLYRSLHTTVVGPGGLMVEVQIRTWEMHQTAEVGIAAHWRYKEGKEKASDLDQHMSWLRGLLEWQKETTDPQEFMEELKVDLFSNEIYVFTPNGDLIQLPEEATPVDFAYAVHTEVGTRCIGARVDSQIVPLSTALETGSTVEILTSPHQHPHRDWLSFIKTPRARSAIRRWLREEEYHQQVRLGQEMVERELRQRRKRAREGALKTVTEAFQFATIEDLYAAIANGDISIGKFYNKLFPKAKPQPPKLQTETRSKNKDALRIHGLNNLMVHYARCCNPIAGDPVVGIVTRGRGLSVHRRDCPNLIHSSEDQERIVELDWDTAPQETFTLDILVSGLDRTNFLTDITLVISNMGIPIVGAEAKTKNGEVHDRFQIEVQNADQVAILFRNLAAVNGVTSVQRLTDISAKLA